MSFFDFDKILRSLKILHLIFINIFALSLLSCGTDSQSNAGKEFPEKVNGSIQHDGLQRKYIIHIPSSYDGTEAVPVIFVLHGGSGTVESVQNFTQMNPVSDREGFIVVYPQGYGQSGMGGFTWADGRGTSADRLGVDDVGFINSLIEEVKSEYTINRNKIYLTGFSNGAFMTQKIACEMNAQIAAIASLGSTMDVNLIETCSPGRPLPVLIINGTADPFVPYEGGPMDGDVPDIISTNALNDFWTDNNNCSTEVPPVDLPDSDQTDNSTATVFEFTNCSSDAIVKHFRINNGGHTWPGVENTNYERIAGETNEDIDASTEIWNFFDGFER